MRNVNNRLRKNHRILSKLAPLNEKLTVTKSSLFSQGFDFEHFTSIYVDKNGTRYFFVYDVGYLPMGDDEYLLMRKKID